ALAVAATPVAIALRVPEATAFLVAAVAAVPAALDGRATLAHRTTAPVPGPFVAIALEILGPDAPGLAVVVALPVLLATASFAIALAVPAAILIAELAPTPVGFLARAAAAIALAARSCEV